VMRDAYAAPRPLVQRAAEFAEGPTR
jgi:hypothetical protein